MACTSVCFPHSPIRKSYIRCMPAHQSKTPKQVCEMSIHQMGSLSVLELVQWIMHRKRERLCRAISWNQKSRENTNWCWNKIRRYTQQFAYSDLDCQFEKWEKSFRHVWRLPIFKNKLFILENFYIYRKFAKVLQRVSLYPIPISPIMNILH